VVEVDLLGPGPCGAFGVVTRCVVRGDDLAAVVGHAGDEHEGSGNDCHERRDAASLIGSTHEPLLR
jgi:hypothetical protein